MIGTAVFKQLDVSLWAVEESLSESDTFSQTVLICGTGYLGAHLFQHLLVSGLRVEFLPAIFKRPPQYLSRFESVELRNYLSQRVPFTMINCSGASAVSESFSNVRTSEQEPSALIRFHSELADWQFDYLYISSAAVYGETTPHGVTENDVTHPISPYGVGKLLAEETAKDLLKSGRFRNLTICRPFSIYSNDLRKRLLHQIASSVISYQSISLAGVGDESRDFLHVSDFCRMMADLLQVKRESSLNITNLGTGIPTTVRQVAEIAATEWSKAKKVSVPIRFSGVTRKGDPKNLVLAKPSTQSARIIPQYGVRNYFQWRFSEDH